MNTLKCKVCQKPLRLGKKYCSRKCYWSCSPKFRTDCKNCGKKFWTYPSWQKSGEGFLCSKECRISWISKNYLGSNRKPGWKNASKARKKLNTLVQRGVVRRERCVICGNIKTHGHHEDYSKPIDVIWLCHKHHQMLHFGKIELVAILNLKNNV